MEGTVEGSVAVGGVGVGARRFDTTTLNRLGFGAVAVDGHMCTTWRPDSISARVSTMDPRFGLATTL